MTLLAVSTSMQLGVLVSRIAALAQQLARDKHGCRVLQKAIEVCSTEEQLGVIASALRGRVVELSEHPMGNFVVQRCVELMPADCRVMFLKEMESHIVEASVHSYACRVVQRFLENCSIEETEQAVAALLRHTRTLCHDQFGNNVVRVLLLRGPVHVQRHILCTIQKHLMEFARCRSSSLVLEKGLEVASFGRDAPWLKVERAALMSAILSPATPGGNSPLQQIMLDCFGNYIVQRVMACSKGAERELVRHQLMAAEPRLRHSNNGRHILAAMQREFGAPRKGSKGSSCKRNPGQ